MCCSEACCQRFVILFCLFVVFICYCMLSWFLQAKMKAMRVTKKVASLQWDALSVNSTCAHTFPDRRQVSARGLKQSIYPRRWRFERWKKLAEALEGWRAFLDSARLWTAVLTFNCFDVRPGIARRWTLSGFGRNMGETFLFFCSCHMVVFMIIAHVCLCLVWDSSTDSFVYLTHCSLQRLLAAPWLVAIACRSMCWQLLRCLSSFYPDEQKVIAHIHLVEWSDLHDRVYSSIAILWKAVFRQCKFRTFFLNSSASL